MKKQRLIMSYELKEFFDQMTEYLEKGWTVVPQTFTIVQEDKYYTTHACVVEKNSDCNDDFQ